MFGNLTKAQATSAERITGRIAQDVLKRRTIDDDGHDSLLQQTKMTDWDAQRIVEITRGNLTIEVDIFVRRNDVGR